ncbi:MAG: hypothetical protein II800_00155 [Lachnospiraceae bacterium]|nr:hypothetical protein [Lachnospiraceae bacterium]
MKLRYRIFLCLIWTAACLAVFAAAVYREGRLQGFSSFNDIATDEEGTTVLYSDNNARTGLVMELDPTGRCLICSTAGIRDLRGYSVYQVDLKDYRYALLGKTGTYGESQTVFYTVMRLNEALEITDGTGFFVLPDGQKLSDFSVDERGIYYTTLTQNGQEAFAWRIDPSELHSVQVEGGVLPGFGVNFSSELVVSVDRGDVTIESGEGEILEPATVAQAKSEPGRFFTEAAYREGTLVLRTDADAPEEETAARENELRSMLTKLHLTVRQRFAIAGYSIWLPFLVILIGNALILLVTAIIFRRRRFAYIAVAMELLLVVLLVGNFLILTAYRDRIRQQTFHNYTEYALRRSASELPRSIPASEEDYYGSTSYHEAQVQLADQVLLSEEGTGLYDLCLVRESDGVIVASASGRNRQPFTDVYGDGCADLIRAVQEDYHPVSETVRLQGRDYHVIGLPINRTGLMDYSIIGIADYDQSAGNFMKNNAALLRFLLMMFVVGSAFILICLWLQSRDLQLLRAALVDLALDMRIPYDKPRVIGTDMNAMWNSIYEIDKNIRAINRSKYLTFEAYYRFAPKNIETILNKTSILEVHGGDVTNLKGTMALLATAGQKSDDIREIGRMNLLMEIMERQQEAEEGIYVAGDCDLSLMKLLFLEHCKGAISFGTELLHELRGWNGETFPNTTVLLHYAPIVYGIAGTKKQSTAFLSSPETEHLERYVGWFRTLHIGLVITQSVRDREEPSSPLRDIGFVLTDEGEKIELYEVLDAYEASLRKAKMDTLDQFREALDLFYRQDFYLARKTFTEVLRQIPQDDLVKWYLFECSYFLNEAGPGEFTGALRTDGSVIESGGV